MGIIWRLTMVLLSTLAAFVIIVHTAEEDIELTYRRDLRSWDSDNGTSRYEQTWRVSALEPTAQKTLQIPTDPWNNNSPEEPLRRRRPGRKRKRRPQKQIATEEVTTQERYIYSEEPQQPYIETSIRNIQETATPKRRRKKPDPNPKEQQNATETQRPLRRRRHRRKRPLSNNWPELSEFNVPQPEEIRLGSVLDPSEITDERIYTDTEGIRQLIEQNNSGNDDQPEINTERDLTDFREQKSEEKQRLREFKEPFSQLTSTREDKSLSEFSLELPDLPRHPKTDELPVSHADHISEKVKDKSFAAIRSFRKIQSKGPMDPVTLKDILKRSNGTSLSEILQQHNLTLADLLSGRESAISVLNSENSFEILQPKLTDFKNANKHSHKIVHNFKANNKVVADSKDDNIFINLETKHGATRLVFENEVTTQSAQTNTQSVIKDDDNKDTFVTTTNPEITPKLVSRRRLPGNRKRLRMKPMLNSTYKSQLNGDLPALTPRHHLRHLQRNLNKSASSTDDGLVLTANETKEFTYNKYNKIPNHINAGATTVSDITIQPFSDSISSQISINNETKNERTNTEASITVTSVHISEISEVPVNITEKPFVISTARHPVNSSTLRQQAFNNRLKRKRQRHRNATTESPQKNILKNLFGASDLVSTSEFVEGTKSPQADDNKKISLEEYITTNIPRATVNVDEASPLKQGRMSLTTKMPSVSSSTEDTARIEIEEILNDIGTNSRLTKILMERNMSLSELVEHRERGSSNIHLADIFHNTSKEPNPPVPFLSKSLLEPISKETYPLRALLDANIHENNAKAASLDLGERNYTNIPVVMDFGNNVNENAENMGIMSLFSNYTKQGEITNKNVKPNSEEAIQKTIEAGLNNTNDKYSNGTRKGKMMTNDQNQDDMVSWNEIFTLMRKTYKNDTGSIPDILKEGPKNTDPLKKSTIDEDIDGDGLIILEDLQHLKDLDSKVLSRENEKIEVKTYERIEAVTEVTGTLDNIPSQSKSVTVATACIAGLAVILFLLTYAAFKWRQEKMLLQKRDVEGENIPTPVFENRKGHKNNSSMRSISPMLSTSNIYTLNTLDSRNGKESPEYMWDTLQKPFQ